jgi:hypothetical protein
LADAEDHNISSPGWNRRTVLKGAAAGTVLWAVPSVSSLATRAAAASNNNTCSPTGDLGTCQPGAYFSQCGDTGPFGECFCFQDVNGAEICVQPVYCDGSQVCAANGDCPSGQTCIAPDNGCGESLCSPCCGSDASEVRHNARSQGGRTTADRPSARQAN